MFYITFIQITNIFVSLLWIRVTAQSTGHCGWLAYCTTVTTSHVCPNIILVFIYAVAFMYRPLLPCLAPWVNPTCTEQPYSTYGLIVLLSCKQAPTGFAWYNTLAYIRQHLLLDTVYKSWLIIIWQQTKHKWYN